MFSITEVFCFLTGQSMWGRGAEILIHEIISAVLEVKIKVGQYIKINSDTRTIDTRFKTVSHTIFLH